MSDSRKRHIKGSVFGQLKRANGSQIAELPAALIVLFFVFFYPVLNLLYLVCAFGAGWYLNNIELREVAARVPLDSSPQSTFKPVTDLPETLNWKGLMGVTESASPQVAQYPLATNPNLVGTSTVQTFVSIKPLFPMPFLTNVPGFCKIPGLGQPITFTYTSTIQQEEQGP